MGRKRHRIRQHELAFRSRGGARRGSGRKPKGRRAGVSHRTRPALAARHPVHVTVRLRAGLPNLRRDPTRSVLERAFAAGANRFGFRLVEYSIQSNHVHLIAEARDRRALSRGMQGLLVRLARALNKSWGRKGSVFADRFHARALRTPREVRAALLYVLHNARHHGVRVVGVDPFTSGPWFDGWSSTIPPPARASPCVSASTWLLRIGWELRGRISIHAAPSELAA